MKAKKKNSIAFGRVNYGRVNYSKKRERGRGSRAGARKAADIMPYYHLIEQAKRRHCKTAKQFTQFMRHKARKTAEPTKTQTGEGARERESAKEREEEGLYDRQAGRQAGNDYKPE